jgi:malonyl-CoA/methylmalonyl-CoA synthetase
MYENLYTLFTRSFPADVSKPAIETVNGRRYTYAELDQGSARFAAHLRRLGLKPGERVAVSVENSPQALFVYLASLRAGLIYLPLNPAYQRAELAYFVKDAAPRLIICRPEAQAVAREVAPTALVETLDAHGKGSLVEASRTLPAKFDPVDRPPDEPAAILYTSGTTGLPKGVMLSTRNLAINALALTRAWGMTSDDVLLHTLPLFHAHGLFVAAHCALLSGAKILLLARFEAEAALRCFERATVFMGVPTHYARLLACPGLDRAACRGMRLFTSGSAPLSAQTFHRFEQRTGHLILERYGMTETLITTSNPLAGPRIAGSVGPALLGVSVRVVDDRGQVAPLGASGQVQVKGDSVFRGYWRQPDKTAKEFTADGFFNTGDIGRLDQNGYLFLVGRAKDLIISGGYNVYPKELELAIERIEGVAESAVFGVPHPDFGEAVVAAVVASREGKCPAEPEIIERLKNEVANYKVPKRVVFVDALPRNAMGKIQKSRLSEYYRDIFADS